MIDIRRLRGHLWMIRKFGIGTWLRYQRARREGVTIDYRTVFTADELARLSEHFVMPWETRDG